MNHAALDSQRRGAFQAILVMCTLLFNRICAAWNFDALKWRQTAAANVIMSPIVFVREFHLSLSVSDDVNGYLKTALHIDCVVAVRHFQRVLHTFAAGRKKYYKRFFYVSILFSVVLIHSSLIVKVDIVLLNYILKHNQWLYDWHGWITGVVVSAGVIQYGSSEPGYIPACIISRKDTQVLRREV